MIKYLVWLPTWHQTRLLCQIYGIDKEKIKHICNLEKMDEPGDELLLLYELLLKAIKEKQ